MVIDGIHCMWYIICGFNQNVYRLVFMKCQAYTIGFKILCIHIGIFNYTSMETQFYVILIAIYWENIFVDWFCIY